MWMGEMRKSCQVSTLPQFSIINFATRLFSFKYFNLIIFSILNLSQFFRVAGRDPIYVAFQVFVLTHWVRGEWMSFCMAALTIADKWGEKSLQNLRFRKWKFQTLKIFFQDRENREMSKMRIKVSDFSLASKEAKKGI